MTALRSGSQGGAGVARWVHGPEDAGASPAPATPDQLALPEPSILNAIAVRGARVVNLRTFWRTAGRLARGPARGRVLDIPADVIRIDRSSTWGNPFIISSAMPRAAAIATFRVYAAERLAAEPAWLEPLRGKRLGCWCAPEPCHGDVIAELIG